MLSVTQKPEMKVSDISALSYKQLQELASSYRIPKNIKKSPLTQILKAVIACDEEKVTKLLKEQKTIRKEKYKKSKQSDITFPPPTLRSPVFGNKNVMNLSQPPTSHWEGNEVGVSCSKNTTHPGNNTNQFNFRNYILQLQRELQPQSCNFNNNHSSLRRSYKTRHLQEKQALHSTQKLFPKNSKEHQPMLLKKMLQAPLRIKQEKIALSTSRHTRQESKYKNQAKDDEDDSGTLTADSDDDNEVEDRNSYNNNINYCYNNLAIGNFGTMTNHFPPVFSNEQYSQLQYPIINSQENCRPWMESSAGNVDLEAQKKNLFSSHYSQCNIEIGQNQMQFQQSGQALEIVYDSNLQNSSNQSNSFPITRKHQDYSYHSIPSMGNSQTNYIYREGEYLTQEQQVYNVQQETPRHFVDCSQPLVSSESNSYDYYFEQPTNENREGTTYTVLDDSTQTNVPELEFDTSRIMQNDSVLMQSNDALSPYWPKWSPKINLLENLLNYHCESFINYAKLEQTQCVNSFSGLITSARVGFQISSIPQPGYCVENRKHDFPAFSLLYCGSSLTESWSNESSNSSITENSHIENQRHDESNESHLWVQQDCMDHENVDIIVPENTEDMLMSMVA